MSHIPSSQKEGLPPGTPVYTGNKDQELGIRVTHFDPRDLEEHDGITPEDAARFLDRPGVSWVDIVGFEPVSAVQELGERFGIHPLALEDVVSTGSRPKMEEYADFLFLVIKVLELTEQGTLEVEHLSIAFGTDWVVTFQERNGDPFDAVRRRITNDIGHVRKRGPDYLAYALLDAVVDHYFVVLEDLADDVEELEDVLLTDTPDDALERIRHLRTSTLQLRRAVLPLREAISALRASRTELVDPETQPYLRDLSDHVAQVLDTIELYRDMIMGMIDLYHTGIANKLNDVMSVLTVVSTVFIPLTFLSGLYGMNFVYMPELQFRYGYFVLLGVMAAVSISLLGYFKYRKWL